MRGGSSVRRSPTAMPWAPWSACSACSTGIVNGAPVTSLASEEKPKPPKPHEWPRGSQDGPKRRPRLPKTDMGDPPTNRANVPSSSPTP
eukprot:3773063-Pyramimonas_sp.AAC.1